MPIVLDNRKKRPQLRRAVIIIAIVVVMGFSVVFNNLEFYRHETNDINGAIIAAKYLVTRDDDDVHPIIAISYSRGNATSGYVRDRAMTNQTKHSTVLNHNHHHSAPNATTPDSNSEYPAMTGLFDALMSSKKDGDGNATATATMTILPSEPMPGTYDNAPSSEKDGGGNTTSTTSSPTYDDMASPKADDGGNPTATSPSSQPVLTLLVRLSGEFGNNIMHILRGWGTAKLAEREFGLTTRFVFTEQLRRTGNPMAKAVSTTKSVQKCMASPSFLKTEDFSLGNKLLKSNYFLDLGQQTISNLTLSDDHATIEDIKDNLRLISDYLKDHRKFVATSNKNLEENIPRIMVQVNSMTVFPIVNEFYDSILETFVFDDEKCCGNKTLENPPYEDESVLHYRNYATEMIERRRKEKGFMNLDKNRLSSEVLGHLKEGDKLAVLGRNLQRDSENNETEAHGFLSVLQARNLTLRFAPGSDGMADFCFLKKTRKELIGTPKSTYLQLAAFLGGPSLEMTRMYQYVTENVTIQEGGSSLDEFRRTVGSNWTHPELKARIHFEEYY